MAFLAGAVFMSVSGLAGTPGGYAMIDQARKKAESLCKQLEWTNHRTAQLNALVKEGEHLDKTFFGPAETIAKTSLLNWKLSKELLTIDNTLFYINAAILSIVMVVYVLLAWLMLLRKRATLQQAFDAVRNIHLQPAAPSPIA